MKTPLVSVIIPDRNEFPQIVFTIQSIINDLETFLSSEEFEIIIVANCCNDEIYPKRALGSTTDYLMGSVKAIIAERERLFDELKKLEWLKPFPSQANFILCSVLNGKAKELRQKLQDKGILVRYFGEPVLRGFIRFSVGKPEHTDTLIKALQEIGG